MEVDERGAQFHQKEMALTCEGISKAFRSLTLLFGIVLLAGFAPQAWSASARFGEVVRLYGEVRAKDVDTSQVRTLSVGDIVYVGEQLEAADGADAVVRTDDGGVVALRSRTIFRMLGFRSDSIADSKFELHLIRGTLRLITGWIGSKNRSSYRVLTSNATLGIRGTDYEPYVMSQDLARLNGTQEGTYSKVNSGGVYLQVPAGRLDLDKGQVGFAPSSPKSTTRGLITALIPVLLEKVPNFYLPGRFDDDLERYAAQALASSLQSIAGGDETTAKPPSVPPVAVAPAVIAGEASKSPNSCAADGIGRRWLRDLDQALERRDAQRFVGLFAEDAQIVARSRLANGEVVETRLNRQEFIQSTFSSLNQLSAFQSERPSTQVKVLDGKACRTIEVRSIVRERGVIAGRSYQLESSEVYELQLVGKTWLAKQAQTDQQ